MSTFFLQANDTLVITDTLVAKLTNSANTCMSCLDKAATNQADVKIAIVIMLGIVAIAIISFVGLILMKRNANRFKKESEERKRKWEEEDKDRKQKSELLNMKLEMMKALCYKTEKVEGSEQKNEKGSEQKYEKVLKSSDDKDVKNYLAELNNYGNDLPLKSKNDKQ